MMPNIHKSDQRITFIEPDDTNIHIDTEFKKMVRSLYAFGTQRRMQGILSKQPKLAFEQLFLLICQRFVVLLKSV